MNFMLIIDDQIKYQYHLCYLGMVIWFNFHENYIRTSVLIAKEKSRTYNCFMNSIFFLFHQDKQTISYPLLPLKIMFNGIHC